jgi:lipoprotein-anchoring transpeptidase ErfK/SrfK
VTFNIGASHVSIADDATKRVSVYDGDALVHTMPTSMGRGGTDKVGNNTLSFWTPPGVYTVMDKSNPVVMDSSTYGLPINSHLGYKESIPYAVRISTDGIYMHELDATVWAQGNTSSWVRPPSWHRLGPGDMSFVAKRCRHRVIATHQVPVGNIVAAGPG